MTTGRDVDLGLFGVWPLKAEYEGRDGAVDADGAWLPALELKSADGAASHGLLTLLNELTGEMQAQFGAFRKMRMEADAALSGSADDAIVRLAKADMKAAADAMQLLVRTLEKIDSLQRTLAHDRALEAERNAGEADYEIARQKLLDLMDERANERAKSLFEQWKRAAGAGGPTEGQAALAAGSRAPPA